jgi:hypothetical protein
MVDIAKGGKGTDYYARPDFNREINFGLAIVLWLVPVPISLVVASMACLELPTKRRHPALKREIAETTRNEIRTASMP